MQIYDKTNIDDAPWSDMTMRDFLVPLVKNGTKKYFDNVETDFRVLFVDDIPLPISINESEPHNSNVCSPYAHYVDYCFNQDGALQRARSELRTFYGHVRRVRDVVRGGDGRYIEVRSGVFDLESGKAIKPPDSFEDQEVPLVRSVADLPFATLLGAG